MPVVRASTRTPMFLVGMPRPRIGWSAGLGDYSTDTDTSSGADTYFDPGDMGYNDPNAYQQLAEEQAAADEAQALADGTWGQAGGNMTPSDPIDPATGNLWSDENAQAAADQAAADAQAAADQAAADAQAAAAAGAPGGNMYQVTASGPIDPATDVLWSDEGYATDGAGNLIVDGNGNPIPIESVIGVTSTGTPITDPPPVTDPNNPNYQPPFAVDPIVPIYQPPAASSGGGGGGSTVTLPPAKPSIQISVTPQSFPAGTKATITWTTKNADSFWINGTAYPKFGSLVVSPSVTTVYQVSATGAGGTTSQNVQAIVTPAGILQSIEKSIANLFKPAQPTSAGSAPRVPVTPASAAPSALSTVASALNAQTVPGLPNWALLAGGAALLMLMESGGSSRRRNPPYRRSYRRAA